MSPTSNEDRLLHIADHRLNTAPRGFLTLRQIPQIGPAVSRIVAGMEARGYSEHDQFCVQLALHEALSNAVRHGNGNDSSKSVTLRYLVLDWEVWFDVADEGTGFDPASVPDPRSAARCLLPSGRGLLLMHAFMTRVGFNSRGNRVVLFKRRGTAQPPFNGDQALCSPVTVG